MLCLIGQIDQISRSGRFINLMQPQTLNDNQTMAVDIFRSIEVMGHN